jgi:hypothetical protein
MVRSTKPAVQRKSGQLRDRYLQGVEAIVQRQEGMTAESHDDGFLVWREGG